MNNILFDDDEEIVMFIARPRRPKSVAEFIDGMPSFDERNFSLFESNKRRSKRVPVYISTEDQPCDQIIVPDKSHLLLPYLYKQWDKKHEGKKKKLVKKTADVYNSTQNRKRCKKVSSTTL